MQRHFHHGLLPLLRLWIGTCAALVVMSAFAPARAQEAAAGYRVPPFPIPDILDASRTPSAVLSPAGGFVILLQPRAMPSIAELAQPTLRLAGRRFAAASGAPIGGVSYASVAVTSIDRSAVSGRPPMPGSQANGGAPWPVAIPLSGADRLVPIGFSPDGTRYALAAVRADAVELWLVDPATVSARHVDEVRLNAPLGVTCEWSGDSASLICLTVPASRGPVPVARAAPSGPNIQESRGKAAPVRTYQDLLTSAHDDALFRHYAASEIAAIPVAGGAPRILGTPGIFTMAVPAPSGRVVLVEELVPPFSRMVRYDDFPKRVHVRDLQGGDVFTLAELPLADRVPINGVPTGPRRYRWDPTQAQRLTWVEAMDEGDPKKQVPHRDRLMSHAVLTRAAPLQWHQTEFRCASVTWTDAGAALVSEYDRPSRRTRTTLVAATGAGALPQRVLFDRSVEDAYANPGTPYIPAGRETVLQHGESIYLLGLGASPDGDRPFADRLDLRTGETQRLFRSSGDQFEQVLAIASPDGRRLLTRYESRTAPPNYAVRTLPDTRVPLTTFADPAPQLAGLTKRMITYTRKDGVSLNGTLYLPPGYQEGTRLPMLMWAYPQEFTSASAAGQVSGSPHRFSTIRGASHLLLLTQGYAILDDPSMPIVGEGETANDRYIEQLVSSAEAAVDAVVSLGVADRDRIAIGGHSYGAFMTANLLAHSDLFRAGLARSGAYNRTLTPFGFQAESRTFWEVPAVYARMSPFWYADKINEPILLTHGEADNNSGTFPMQSERLYMALKGHGATVRYVTLPHESHGYAARESVLHVVAEMLDWMNTHVKPAPARSIAPTAAKAH